MSSLCLGFVPQWRQVRCFMFMLNSKRTFGFVRTVTCSSTNEDASVSAPKPKQLGYDPSEDLFGHESNLKPRGVKNANLGARKPRPWFGPNGLYIRELPCPSCRGRGYTPCTECGIERSRSDCSQCVGKGIMTCRQCLGDCLIWEESIDERPWEKARSISPLQMKEDDEVDNLEIKLDVKRKSKRVYQSPPPEVGLKISRSLKSLNAKTGLFSKRMKIIHSDPMLHAQRVAAIKKVKGTAAARKHASETLKAFFSDPENCRKRSLSMQGVKYYCRNCGREGHRRHYCPELKATLMNGQFICSVCGEKGHNRRTCPKLLSRKSTLRRPHRCRTCDQRGHNRTTCPKVIEPKSGIDINKGFDSSRSRRTYKCKLCKENGRNSRTCPAHNRNVLNSSKMNYLIGQDIQHEITICQW